MKQQAVSFSDRQSLLTELKDNGEHQWAAVVSDGIIGAGILREACRNGSSALLFEQRDFACGISSSTSKMVHGGLRYIAQGDIKLTKHSVQEQERLLREAPGLINRMGYYFLIRKGQYPGRFVMSTLLIIYDWLAGIKDNRFFSKIATIKAFSGIEESKLKGACYFTGTVVEDTF
jgi:glycerol-3-phosphate dehydrogenase